MRKNNSEIKSLDGLTFGIYLALMAIGWLMIYTVGYGEGYPNSFGAFLDTSVGKQTIWIAISLVVFFFVFVIDWKFWRTFAYLIYAFSLILLVLVLFVGSTIKGATSWFSFGGVSIQPSEIAKFATCLALSSFLSTYNTSLKDANTQIIAIALFIAPMVLILLQPDAGSALVFFILFHFALSRRVFLHLLFSRGSSHCFAFIGFGLSAFGGAIGLSTGNYPDSSVGI